MSAPFPAPIKANECDGGWSAVRSRILCRKLKSSISTTCRPKTSSERKIPIRRIIKRVPGSWTRVKQRKWTKASTRAPEKLKRSEERMLTMKSPSDVKSFYRQWGKGMTKSFHGSSCCLSTNIPYAKLSALDWEFIELRELNISSHNPTTHLQQKNEAMSTY